MEAWSKLSKESNYAKKFTYILQISLKNKKLPFFRKQISQLRPERCKKFRLNDQVGYILHSVTDLPPEQDIRTASGKIQKRQVGKVRGQSRHTGSRIRVRNLLIFFEF